MKTATDYHLKQYKKIYESTKAFCNWLDSKGCFKDSKKVLDVCCGGGANICYLARKYPTIKFTGIDISDDVLTIAKEHTTSNCNFIEGDMYNLGIKYQNAFDGVIGFQMLSWMPKEDFRDTILPIINLNPKWIALSSLFYEGNVEYIIRVKRYANNHMFDELYYNIFSMNPFRDYLKRYGYDSFSFVPFEINIDLPKRTDGDIGTFTEVLMDGRRIQISGGLLMSWYFILAEKTKQPTEK